MSANALNGVGFLEYFPWQFVLPDRSSAGKTESSASLDDVRFLEKILSGKYVLVY